MRRADRAVTDREKILRIIEACDCCRIGFSCPDGAYIVPLSFAFIPGMPDRFYFHGAREGRKAELSRSSPRVGFELDCAHALTAGETGCSYSCRYQSVIGTGTLRIIADLEEKKQALAAIMAHYEKSRTFAFTDEQAQRVAVFRLDVTQMSCKEHG